MTYTKTPTAQFQSLIDSKSKEEITLLFLEHLKVKFPVPSDIKITVTFQNKAHKTDGGSVTMYQIHRTADITLLGVASADVMKLMSTVAHEYKHIHQAWVEGLPTWTSKKLVNFNWDKEIAAGVFGAMESRKFCYGW